MSTSDITSTDKRDVYARVTAQIINAIENGVGTWRMPWHTSGRYAFSPINATSKKPYRGIHTVCLWAAVQAKVDNGGKLLPAPFRALSFRDVSNSAGNQRTFFGLQRTEADLNRELDSILA